MKNLSTTLTNHYLKYSCLLFLFIAATSLKAQTSTCDAHFAHYSLQNPDSLHFYPSSTAAQSYFWTFGDDDPGSSSTDPWHLYSGPGTYNVCLTVIESNGDACTWCDTVQIGSTPPTCSATFSYYTINNPDSLHFYPTHGSGNAYYWNFGDGTYSDQQYPWHYYSHSGTYDVCLTVGDSSGIACTSCDTVTVNASTPCIASFNHYSIDNPDSLHFYSTGTGAVSWYWNFGDGTTSDQQYPWHFYHQPGTYYVCLTIVDSAGGTCSACDNVHVGAPPACSAAFSHYPSTANADSLHFYSTGSGIQSWYWNFGDGVTSTHYDPWHLFIHGGTYVVCLTVVDSSGATCNTCDTVSVSAPPCNATFTYYSITPDTGAVTYRFHAATTTAGTTYYWNWGDGTTSVVTVSNPAHTFAHSGVYNVCLTIGDTAGVTCTWCDTVVIVASAICNATFIHYPWSSADPDSIHLFPLGWPPAHSYYWNFGDGSTSTFFNPSHTYAGPGTYYVCLTVDTNGITCSTCDTVQIGPAPPLCSATFTYYTINNPDSLHFYPTGTAASSYYWSFGDGSTSTLQYPWHYYASGGKYLVCLYISDTLGNTCSTCDTVTVAHGTPTCNAGFSHYFLTNSDSAHFYPAVTNAASYYWDFGDGTNSTNADPWHYFTSAGTYHVCLTVAVSGGSSCTNCDTVVVTAPVNACNASFSYYTLNNPDSLHYYPTGTGAVSWYWSFGDSGTSDLQYPWHFYKHQGTYYVCLTVAEASGLTCTTCQYVKVGPASVCNSSFVHYPWSTTDPDSIHFFPLGPQGPSYYWNFGDGSTATFFNPSHNYAGPGTYYVCLTVADTNGVTCITCDTVNVGNIPTCTAAFSHYSNTNNTDSLHFYPTSAGAIRSYYWSFGDDSTSSAEYPWHYYTQNGSYYVCLTAVDTNGTTCTSCDTVNIGKPGFMLAAHHYDTRSDTAQFYTTGDEPYACYWDMGDGTHSIEFSPTHYYSAGTFYITLTAATNTGEIWVSYDTVFASVTNVATILPTTAQVKVFPNPANEAATVELTGLPDYASFKIYDITGRVVYSKLNLSDGEFTLSTKDIAPGLYFFTTTMANSQVIAEGKIMVVH